MPLEFAGPGHAAGEPEGIPVESKVPGDAAGKPEGVPVESTAPGDAARVPRVVPIACSLSGGDQAGRVRQWQSLLAQAQGRELIEDGVRFDLPATLAGQAAELAAAEQRCCPFFGFTLRLEDGGLKLEIRAPGEAWPMVREMFGTAS